MARALHERTILRSVLVMMFAGCVIPPSLSVDTTDAGANSPPAIISVRSDLQELPEPGPVLFEQGMGAGTLNLTLVDTDVDDTLYVRIFVDYNKPDATAARSECTTGGNNVVRTCSPPMEGVCLGADIGQERYMTVVVFDRQLLETGEAPLYQAMLPGGLSTSRAFFLRCQAPSL